MKKIAKIKSPWIGIKGLEKILQNFDVTNEFKLQFISFERVGELQEIFFLIKKYLHEYPIEDDKTLDLIRNELEYFSQMLGEVKREWEDCIYEIDMISQKLKKDEIKSRAPSNASAFKNELLFNPKNLELNVPKKLNGKEEIEFAKLLFEISKSRIVKIEDTRAKPGGGLFVSLLGKPGYVEAIKLKRLVALGLEVWPGKNFLI